MENKITEKDIEQQEKVLDKAIDKMFKGDNEDYNPALIEFSNLAYLKGVQDQREKEIFIAHLATANYDFYLVADSEETMWAEMELSWQAHAKKTNATLSWEDVKDSVWWNKQQINLTWKRG